jgi:hypothetical protein
MKCDCIIAHNLYFDGEVVRKEMWRNRNELKKHNGIERTNIMCGIFTKKFNDAYHIDTFCTMKSTISLCGIEFEPKPMEIEKNEENLSTDSDIQTQKKTTQRKKFPRLTELYCKLFENAQLPNDLHNSIVDVLVCLRCFLKVRSAKEIEEEYFRELVDKHSRATI